MGLFRGIDGSDPIGSRPVARRVGARDVRRSEQGSHVATGTLACPECDAPVALAGARVFPTDALACPFCEHRAAVRDFLSLSAPARPARVTVHLVARTRPARR